MEETLRIMMPIVIAHVVVWVVVVLVIRKMLLSDTVSAVDRIGEAETELRRYEERLRQEMQLHEEELATQRRQAESELTSARENSESDVEKMREQVVEEARREAADVMDKARKSERKLREQVALEMEEKAVDFGGRVFRLVFSDRLNKIVNSQFVDELLDALEETDATGISVEASTAEFSSSHPLETAQKERLQSILADKFGVNIEVNESVREELLAGLVMKIGSLEIDGSLLSRYQEAVIELKKEAA
jgi:F0F1-type ATP synthase membrane subunit b/b'